MQVFFAEDRKNFLLLENAPLLCYNGVRQNRTVCGRTGRRAETWQI